MGPALGYYIQDQEAWFYTPGTTEFNRAMATYRDRPEIRRVTKSRWNAAAIAEIGVIPPTCVGPSVDLPLFRPLSDDGLDPSKPVRVVAMVQAINSATKRQDLTYRILERLKHRFDHRVSVACFGAHPDELAFLGYAPGDVEILGDLTPKLVAATLGATDIFLDFSLWQAMGLTVLEAMASGCAVVVPKRGGTVEFCPDHTVGLAVESGDEEQCFSAAQRLVEDFELRFALRHKSIEVAASYPSALAGVERASRGRARMIRIHLMPETDLSGPLWACAEIRLVRPYSHSRLAHLFEVTVGPKLPEGQLDVVVTQRAGSSGMTLSNMEKLVSAIKAKQAKLVYDLDDDLLARHPIQAIDRELERARPKIRFLLREADMVTVSTPLLAQQLVAFNPNIVFLPNSLDEALIPELDATTRGADLGYVGTQTPYLPDLMAIKQSLEWSSRESKTSLRLELSGGSRRIRGF